MKEIFVNGLTKCLQSKFIEFRLTEKEKTRLLAFLGIIRNHNYDTYSHSIRVGLKCVEIAYFLNLDPKPLFYGGLLHDLGKVGVKARILKKKAYFTDADSEKMKKHPELGYVILEKIYPFSAEILLRHHRFGVNPYPEKLPALSYDNEAIEKYAQILALVDFYDALTNRKNNKFDIDIKNKSQVMKLLISNNKNQEHLIKKLFKNNILI